MRHCERSEAIRQRWRTADCFVAAPLAMTRYNVQNDPDHIGLNRWCLFGYLWLMSALPPKSDQTADMLSLDCKSGAYCYFRGNLPLGVARLFLWRLASYPCLRSRSIKTARNRAGPPCAFQAWLVPRWMTTLPGRNFLLSGLLVCGSCGGGYTIVGPDRYGCAPLQGHLHEHAADKPPRARGPRPQRTQGANDGARSGRRLRR